MKELKATRVPPGDRWAIVDDDEERVGPPAEWLRCDPDQPGDHAAGKSRRRHV